MALDGDTSDVRSAANLGKDSDVITDVTGILDTVDLPIIVIGRDCRVVRFNRAATTVDLLATSWPEFWISISYARK